MKTDIDIDSLLDEADLALARRQNRQREGIYRNGSEFEDPFYVIVHDSVLRDQRKLLNPDSVFRVERELNYIRDRYSYVRSGPFLIDSRVSRGRPVIVCGCFLESCVGTQYDLLIRNGYEAYISREGVLSLFDLYDDGGTD